MEITFNCDCGQRLKVDYGDAGEVFECPACSGAAECPMIPIGPGVTIGGFFIHDMLGSGAMGKVYKAEQKALKRMVALKLLASHVAWDEDAVKRFYKEMRMAAKIRHPNIVGAIDAGEDNDVYFLAMEYVDGMDGEEWVEGKGPLSQNIALTLARGVARGLNHAWEEVTMIHRDIKPANIMILEDGTPKLMDMGLARSVTNNDGLTLVGTVMGTPVYMSPEQIEAAEDLDCRTDIYSLGCSLYHMVTGVVPFEDQEGGVDGAMLGQKESRLVDPRQHAPTLTLGFYQMLVRMMARDRENRHPDWKALLEDIKSVSNGGGPRWRDDELVQIESLIEYTRQQPGGPKKKKKKGFFGF